MPTYTLGIKIRTATDCDEALRETYRIVIKHINKTVDSNECVKQFGQLIEVLECDVALGAADFIEAHIMRHDLIPEKKIKEKKKKK